MTHLKKKEWLHDWDIKFSSLLPIAYCSIFSNVVFRLTIDRIGIEIKEIKIFIVIRWILLNIICIKNN